jgi:hypothetical protein
MSLPARQQRVLDQIEVILQARDPRLTSLFASFARLTSHEAMPKVEELKGWVVHLLQLKRRLIQPVMLIPVVVVAIVGSVVLGSFVPSSRCTSATRGAVYVIAGKQSICSPGAAGRTGSRTSR